MPPSKFKSGDHTMAWCPVHEYDRWRCDADCERQRNEALRAAAALRRYFWARAHGQRPRAEYFAELEAAHDA